MRWTHVPQLLLALSLMLTACGGCNEEDLCEDVTCEDGVCDVETGECRNAASCGGDSECLAGWACVTDVCVPMDACNTDGTCDRGECVDGACVNPSSCNTNAECAAHSFCDDGVCNSDPCFETSCDRGVCQVGVGMCVNEGACTTANEEVNCLEGFRCRESECVDEATFCEDLACDRGECSFAELACTNPGSCADDVDCLDGYYCDEGACAVNACDDDMVECARGVCDAATAECVNPATCASSDACVDGFACVADTCVTIEDACQVGGCDGNQVCDIDDDALTATCVESADGCTSALDCSAERVCVARVCEAPQACVADALEPNDDAANAVDFQAAAPTGSLQRLSLCGGDVDMFTFDSLAAANLDGTLLARIDIVSTDVGLGTLNGEIIDPDGNVVATATNTTADGPTNFIELQTDVDVLSAGVYTVRVSDGGDVTTAGVRYDLAVDVVTDETLAACGDAAPLRLGMPVVGDTSTNYGSLSTCNDTTGTAPEQIFTIDVAEPGFLDVQVTPSVGYDVALSLLGACTAPASQVEGSCLDDEDEGGVEALSLQVEPGRYFLVVESVDAMQSGTFVASATLSPQICTSADNSCMDADNALVCNDRRTGFETLACADGCDSGTGACLRPGSDTCATAIAVDPATGYTGAINWAAFGNDYDPGSNGCVPDNSNSSSDGPDVVFSVTVPDGQIVTASIERVGSNYISAYLVTDCGDLANTCLAGANEGGYSNSDEFLYWRNDTGTPQDVFVIADSEQWSSYGVSPVDIQVAPFVCQPGESRCVLDRESQTCNPAGTGYDATQPCDNGCEAATGTCVVTNDVCTGALPLTPGVVTQGTVINYTDTYDAGTCGPLSSFDVGNGAEDAVFVITTTTPNEAVTIDVDPTGFDPIVWVAASCTTGALSGCFAAVDDSETDGFAEQLEFLAPTAGDYFVVVEDGDSGGSVGTFDISYTTSPSACTPGEVLGCNPTLTAIEVCDPLGQIGEYICGTGGCDAGTGRCVNPTGQVCADAVTLSQAGGSLTGQPFMNDGTNDLDFDTPVDQCDFATADAAGDEYIYAIDLFAGDYLEVSFSEISNNFSDYGSIYLLDSCGPNPAMCTGFDGTDGNQSLEFFAQVGGTYYLVVDSRSSTSTSTFDYDLNWTVTQPGWLCEPASRACAGPNTATICSGDGFNQAFITCACQDGFCQVDPAQNDTCSTATDIGSGASVALDPTLFTNAVDIPSSDDTCFNNIFGTSGQDAFYTVTLSPYQVVEVRGIANGEFDYPVVYFFDDCASPQASCLAGDASNSSSADAFAQYQAGASSETIYIALDIDAENLDAIYQYDISVRDPECLPTDPLVCNADGTALETCAPFGVVEEYSCLGGCSNGACNVPRGDSCFDTFTLSGTSGAEDGDWSMNTNAVEPGEGKIAGCAFDDIDETDGVDDIYSIALAAGQTLTASLDTNETSARLYFVGDCTNPAPTCLATDIVGEAEAPVSYHATVAETVFVVVDRTDTTDDNAYTLNWVVETGNACAPNSTRCADSTTVELCGPNGQPTLTQTCASGCMDGACAASTANDTCGGAIDIGTGLAVWTTYDQFTNTLDFGGACAGTTEDGPDFFYQANLQADQILRVHAAAVGTEDPLVYIASDCSGTDGSCLVGAHEDSPGQQLERVNVEYQAPTEQTVYIGIGSESTFADEPIFVRMEVLTPDCDPATFQQSCNAAGDGFFYCDDRSFTREYACAGNGLCNGATGRCEEPVGDLCLDPFDATPTMAGTARVLSGSFDGLADDIDLGTGNMCTGSRTIAAEPVYVVDLFAGETLTATVVSTEASPDDLALIATPSCGDVASQCVDGSDQFGATSDPETVTYTATQDGSLYLIVDSFYGLTTGGFDLSVTVN